MKFTISEFYTNPNYHFDFSYKILLSIRTELRQVVNRHLEKHSKIKSGYLLDIQFDTNRKFKKTSFKTIVNDNRNRTISFVVFIAYDRVAKSKDPIKSFIEEVFVGIGDVFKKSGVKYNKFEIHKNKIIDKYKSGAYKS